MAERTETLNVRVSPELKELIQQAGPREHSTVANCIEVVVREHCARHSVGEGGEPQAKLPKRR